MVLYPTFCFALLSIYSGPVSVMVFPFNVMILKISKLWLCFDSSLPSFGKNYHHIGNDYPFWLDSLSGRSENV